MIGKVLLNIKSIFGALKAGQSLTHIETWKNTQVATEVITTLLLVLATFAPQLGLNDVRIHDISLCLALFGGVLTSYWSVATTDKVGFGPKPVSGGVSEPAKADDVSTKNSLNGGADLLSGK